MSFLLIKIGQNDDNDVILSHPSIAPEHAEIFVDVEGNVFLTDLGTGKDTFVNGNKLVDSIELKSIDQVNLGEGIELDWKALLKITQSKTISVGSGKSNDFVIDSPSVAENHLHLIQDQNDSYFINDLASEQGTYVNGNRISEIALLKAGDVVHVGDELLLWKSIFLNFETTTDTEKAMEVVEVVDLSKDKPLEILPLETLAAEPDIIEKIDVSPEPINFVVEPEELVISETPKVQPLDEKEVMDEPIIDRPAQNIPHTEKPIIEKIIIDSTNAEFEKSEAIERKKELIQLAVIVAADILLLILISAWM